MSLGREDALLAIRGLEVTFLTERGPVYAVRGVDLDLAPGASLGIVGESGSGKSVTALSVLGLVGGNKVSIAGTAQFRGRDLLVLPESELNDVRGAQIAMVFQDPMTSLNPVVKVGKQIAEQIRAHEHVSRTEAWQRSVHLLGQVGVPNPERRVEDFPHQFSGGMRQRVMIALALSCQPALLIADEPTTALDVTVQAQVLALIRDLRESTGAALILITHDLGVVAEVVDDVAVMYAGRVVERGSIGAIFDTPSHPYTWSLLGCVTRLDRPPVARLPVIPGPPATLQVIRTDCVFRDRCPHAFERCVDEPPLEERSCDPLHLDRCWLSPEDKATYRGRVQEGVGAR